MQEHTVNTLWCFCYGSGLFYVYATDNRQLKWLQASLSQTQPCVVVILEFASNCMVRVYEEVQIKRCARCQEQAEHVCNECNWIHMAGHHLQAQLKSVPIEGGFSGMHCKVKFCSHLSYRPPHTGRERPFTNDIDQHVSILQCWFCMGNAEMIHPEAGLWKYGPYNIIPQQVTINSNHPLLC